MKICMLSNVVMTTKVMNNKNMERNMIVKSCPRQEYTNAALYVPTVTVRFIRDFPSSQIVLCLQCLSVLDVFLVCLLSCRIQE